MQYNQEVALGLCNEDWAEFNLDMRFICNYVPSELGRAQTLDRCARLSTLVHVHAGQRHIATRLSVQLSHPQRTGCSRAAGLQLA